MDWRKKFREQGIDPYCQTCYNFHEGMKCYDRFYKWHPHRGYSACPMFAPVKDAVKLTKELSTVVDKSVDNSTKTTNKEIKQ